ncbi:hypothetical protein [Clostridium botulinum]|nr:hypothetical protein [Clostridium botulinum]AEB77259.1 hypothetical protein CbC4_4058 [Clostridium botulinum BKT015925]
MGISNDGHCEHPCKIKGFGTPTGSKKAPKFIVIDKYISTW